MIRGHKVMAVASFEFISTVKRKGYLIATFGMPFFMLLYIGIIGLVVGTTAHKKESELKVWGVVDNAQILHLTEQVSAPETDPMKDLPPAVRAQIEMSPKKDLIRQSIIRGTVAFRAYPDEAAAKAAMNSADEARKIKGYFVVAPDYVKTGRVDSYKLEGGAFESGGHAGDRLGDLLVQRLLEDKVPADIAARVKDPISKDGKSWTIGTDGKQVETNVGQEIAKFGVPVLFGVLMAISVFGTAGYLIQAVGTEKENKVIDVLLSSADADEILAGKLLGLGGAGLLQVLVWFSMAGAGGIATATVMALAGIAIPWVAIAMGLVYFVLGYLLIGGLVLGLASLGSTARESQQIAMFANFLMMPPLILMQSLIMEPQGTLARVFTWIPFTSPITMVLRLAVEPKGVAWWEVAGSVVVIAAAIWLMIKFGARLFRIGVLLTGARPKVGQILKQALASPR